MQQPPMLESNKDSCDLFNQIKSANTPRKLETGKIIANGTANKRGSRHTVLPELHDINLEKGKITTNTSRRGRRHKLPPGLHDIRKSVYEDGNNENVNKNATCDWGTEQKFITGINNKDLLNYTHQPPIIEITRDFWDSFHQIRLANLSGYLDTDKIAINTDNSSINKVTMKSQHTQTYFADATDINREEELHKRMFAGLKQLLLKIKVQLCH